ncbi:hypothetical protein NQ314_014927 [Rhamnusium bicolor]|uniref:Uncharacterized protein n=1 Tax=Rhamnusium bicolor TaxID=1586634 RepID=A0AAV8X0D8_9CUCU|nr:hypothetical protein NQ314_014927 [Rhamnusium bicolor]
MKTAFVFTCVVVGALLHLYITFLLTRLPAFLKLRNISCSTSMMSASPIQPQYVDHELLHNLSQNLDNPQVGAHMLCESVKVGLQKENGDLDLAVIKSKISLSVSDKAKVDRLVRECAVKKNTAKKTAINLFMCLDKDGVTYFHEF